MIGAGEGLQGVFVPYDAKNPSILHIIVVNRVNNIFRSTKYRLVCLTGKVDAFSKVLEAILDVAAGYNVLVLLLRAVISAHFDTQIGFLDV